MTCLETPDSRLADDHCAILRTGDSRQYLPPRHWCCVELKGGGINASAKKPWQAYRDVAGHFDRLANELQLTLISAQHPQAAPVNSKPGKQRILLETRAAQLRQQHNSKRCSMLQAGKGGGSSSSTAKPFYTAEELKVGLQADWDHCVAAVHLIM